MIRRYWYGAFLLSISCGHAYGMQRWGRSLLRQPVKKSFTQQRIPFATFKPSAKESFSEIYRNYPALKWTAAGAALTFLYAEQDPIKALIFNSAPPLTLKNITNYPQYKDIFIQKAIDTLTTIDQKVLLELLNLYPDSAAQFLKPVAEHVEQVPSAVVQSILRKYEKAADVLIVPVMTHFDTIDPNIIIDIMMRNHDAAHYFIAPAVLHFAQTPPEVLGRILFFSPEAAKAAFTGPALQHWQSVDPVILRFIVNNNPKAPAFLKERVKMLSGQGETNELFYS